MLLVMFSEKHSVTAHQIGDVLYAACPPHPLQFSDRKPESESLPAVSLTIQLLAGFSGSFVLLSQWIYRDLPQWWVKSSVWALSSDHLLSYWRCLVAALLSCHEFISLERRKECSITTAAQVFEFHLQFSDTWSVSELHSRGRGEWVEWKWEKVIDMHCHA